jgi:RNA polymerase sigma factor (sigma-70 family)
MSNKEDQYLKLMQENRHMIFRIASFYCNNPSDLKDLSQEIAYQIWKSFDSFRAESEMSTWLYRIALNTSIQFLKREKRRPEQLLNDVYDFDAHIDEQAEANDQEIQQLMHAIQGLKAVG